ncbi:hypothetical protein HY025_05890 [Candidatus Daviesbacteria bacterium]|nr:hypothetical protein [Candidatus Daviesbacteria bacterium]
MPVTSPELSTRLALDATPRDARERKILESSKEKARGTGEDARHILDQLKQTGLPPITDRAINEGVKQAIPGSVINPDGSRARSAEEATRASEATASSELVGDFISIGYIRLSGPQKTQIEGMVDQILQGLPEAQANFASGALNKRTVIQNLLNDPTLKPLVRQMFEQAIKPQQALEQIDPKIRAKYDREKAKRDRVKAENDRVQTELANANRTLGRFRISTGSEGEIWAQLTSSRTRDEQKILQAGRDLEKTNHQLDSVRDQEEIYRHGGIASGGITIPPDLDRADHFRDVVIPQYEEKVRTLQAQKDEAEQRMNELAKLDAAKKEAETNKKNLDEQKDKVDKDLEDANYDLHLTQIELLDAQNKAGRSQEQFVEGLNTVIPKAVLEQLEKKIENLETAQREALKKEAEETTDKAKKTILNGLTNRWEQVIKQRNLFGTREVTKFREPQINADFNKLVINGPDRVIKAMLMSPPLSMSADEADKKLAEEGFKESVQSKVVESLVRKRIATSKLSEAEARMIVESPWGENVITGAITTNSTIGGKIKELKAAQGMKGTVKEWLSKKTNSDILKILMWVFGALGVTLVAGPPAAHLAAQGVGAAAGKATVLAHELGSEAVDAFKSVTTRG